jgi:hypothetical protein
LRRHLCLVDMALELGIGCNMRNLAASHDRELNG